MSYVPFQADTSSVEAENKALQDHRDAVQDKLTGAINKNKDLLANLEQYWEQEEKLDERFKETESKLEENKLMVMDVRKLGEQLARAQVRYVACSVVAWC